MIKMIFGLLAVCWVASPTVVEGMGLSEDNFMYESMIEYREVGKDSLYGRSGITSIERALLYERRFLAGNKNILEKIKELEKAAEKDNCSSGEVLDFGIRSIIGEIQKTLAHCDENGEIQYFSLKDKAVAIDEIIMAYQSLSTGEQYYNTFKYGIFFWQHFKNLMFNSLEEGAL